jgi:hypothetical protein
MRKAFLLQFYRVIFLFLSLILLAVGYISVLEIKFELAQSPTNFMSILGLSVIILPVFAIVFMGMVHFHNKISEYRHSTKIQDAETHHPAYSL